MKVMCDKCKWTGDESDCVTRKARNVKSGEVSELGVLACPACMENVGEPGEIRIMREDEDEPISSDKVNRFFEDSGWSEILPIESSNFTWFCILGALQLALRHPAFTGPSSSVVREIAYQVAMRIIKDVKAVDADFVRNAGWQEFGIDPDAIYKNIITPDQIDIVPQ